jgi:hypothetical protein
VSQLLLGDKFSWVHHYMDGPAKSLGPAHRRLRHDDETALSLWLRSGDSRAYLAARLHIYMDQSDAATSLDRVLKAQPSDARRAATKQKPAAAGHPVSPTRFLDWKQLAQMRHRKLPLAIPLRNGRYLSGQDIASILQLVRR